MTQDGNRPFADLVSAFEKTGINPEHGLGEELFLFVSRLTPIVNVDLLIKDNDGSVLLVWRDDVYYKAGWHVPGGVVRYKERFSERIRAVSRTEVGTDVVFEPQPRAVNEIIHPAWKERGHFVSLLFSCRLLGYPDPLRQADGAPKSGQWRWHKNCPPDLIEVHEIYRKYI